MTDRRWTFTELRPYAGRRLKLRRFVKELRALCLGDPRDALEVVADGKLIAVPALPSSPISTELAEFVAGAIEQYLSDRTKTLTLDAAFGFKPKRGAPKREQQKHVDIARAILGHKLRGASWKEITDGLSPVYGITDTRTLQRIFNENEVLVLTEELTRHLQKTGA